MSEQISAEIRLGYYVNFGEKSGSEGVRWAIYNTIMIANMTMWEPGVTWFGLMQVCSGFS